ncbi:MAG TPA: FAD-binding protein, partial [Nitrospirota bacterium]
SVEGKQEALRLILKTADTPVVVAGGHWIQAFGLVSGEVSSSGKSIGIFGGVSGIAGQGANSLVLSLPAYGNRLIRKEALSQEAAFITVPQDAEFPAASARNGFEAAALDFTIDAEWLMPLPPESGPSLSQAEVIIDLGYGIKDKTGFALAQELKKKLVSMGLAPMFGATRKVTQDLKLLPLDAQIGQTGVGVNPRLIIALGISGAPQHIDYLGTRAEVLCFNKDAEAPLMKLNQTRPSPRVHPVAGDLFVTVKELIEKLG